MGVVLICISLLTNYIEQLFMWVLATEKASSETCLFTILFLLNLFVCFSGFLLREFPYAAQARMEFIILSHPSTGIIGLVYLVYLFVYLELGLRYLRLASSSICNKLQAWTFNPLACYQVLGIRIYHHIQFYCILVIKLRDSYIPSKHSANWAINPFEAPKSHCNMTFLLFFSKQSFSM